MYQELAIEYLEKNLITVPLNGKFPFRKNWQDTTAKQVETLVTLKSTEKSNIGILLGKVSGIIALDIDKDDKKVLDKAPKSPLVKKGKKGETRFFKYSGELSRKYHHLGYEVLSEGNQTVLPPSVHPEINKPYVWLSEDTLLNFDIEDLPAIDKEFLEWCDKQPVPSDSNEGRHNRMLAAAGGKVERHEFRESIINELLQEDFDFHSTHPDGPYFEDSREHRETGRKAAEKLLNSVIQTHNRKNPGNKYNPQELVITFNEEKPREVFKRKKLPHLRGIGEVIFDYIYDQSPIPRSQFAFASSIATISTLIGNRYRYQNILPNLYILMIAPSGYGKDAPIKFPNDLFIESGLLNLVGEGSPASDTAVMMNLPQQRIRLDMIDEAESLFAALNNKNNSYATKMSGVYASIYSSSGSYFRGKNLFSYKNKDNEMGNVGACYSPYVSILGAMTPEAFQESLTLKTIQTGLGARFLYFFEDTKKRSRDIEIKPIPQYIHDFAKVWNKKFIIDLKPDQKFDIPQIKVTDEARAYAKEIIEDIEDRKEKINENEKYYPILNRAYENCIKLAMIDACASTLDASEAKIHKDNLKWAHNFIDTYIHNMADFVDHNISSNQSELSSNKLLNFIRKYPKGVSRSEITSKNRWCKKRERLEMLSDLCESGAVREVKKEGSGAKKITYYTAVK